MKISTKGRYGLRAMLDLVINSLGDHVPLKNIAERQNISESYLEQVFAILKKAGLVTSIKGSQGGYSLAKPAGEITVGSILRVLEGELSVMDKKGDTVQPENKLERCLSLNVWSELDNAINSLVDGITLEDIIIEYRKLNEEEVNMYFI